MIVTCKTEKVYNVQMTEEQAFFLTVYFSKLDVSDIDALCVRAGIQPGTTEHGKICDAVTDLGESLKGR